MPGELDFSVIVPCRNELRFLPGFLQNLKSQEGLEGRRWEVLIAEGMSDDGSRELLDDWADREPGFRIVENPGRIVPTGLNRLLRLARGEVIIRLDVHASYAPDYLASCLRVLEETGADNVGGAYRPRGEGRTQRAVAAAFPSRFAVGGARSHFQDYEGPVETVFLGCWKRSKLMELGLFDEKLVRNQDDELNLRLVRSGGRIWQSASIRVDYYPRSTLRGLFRQYFEYGYWKVSVIRKHRIPTSARHLVPGMLAAGLILPLPLLPFFGTLRILWMGLVGAYAAFLALGSLRIAAKAGWGLLHILPVILACFHLGYGLGFLRGTAALAGAAGKRRPRPARNPGEPPGSSSRGPSGS